MKKTIIALFALTSVVSAEDAVEWIQLTLDNSDIVKTHTEGETTLNVSNANTVTIGDDGLGSLSTKSSALGWTENITLNESWKLAFTLTDKAIANANIFTTGTRTDVSKDNQTQLPVSATFGPQNYTLKVLQNGALQIDSYPASAAGLITANTATAITLVFRAEEDTAGNDMGGTFLVYVGENAGEAVISQHVNSRVSFGENKDARLWTNSGAETFSGIAIYSGGVVTIPEPTTATLSLLALAGLAARRRRQ